MDPAPSRSTQRIVDANLNRAAEALRVAEDICRFHWSLSGFAADLKGLRHSVLRAVAADTARRAALVLARDIEGDVGTATPSPIHPEADLHAVALRNLQRAKEAIRTLEEVTRPRSAQDAAELMRIRYELYSVEKGIAALGRGDDLRARLHAASLYLLAGPGGSARPIESVVAEALDAGVDMVQLRVKGTDDRTWLGLARALREITARAGALFVVNDRPDVAVLCGADGVHVGQEDLPLAEARKIVGPKRIVGVSAHSADQARAAERGGADYVGVGPVFRSSTKDAGPTLGTEGLARILGAISLPAFPIGGITPERLPEVVEAGGARAAVSAGVLRAAEVTAAVRAYREALAGAQKRDGGGG